MAETLKIIIDADVKGSSEIKGLQKDLENLGKSGKEVSPGLDAATKSTGSFGGAIKGLVAGGALLSAGKLLLDFGKASISAASDVQEMQSKFDTVFKNLGGEVTAELQKFADTANRSVYDLQGFAATLQDTFVPLGFARDQAADMSVEIVKLAEDLASFNNLNTADVVADLQSALVGNTETLRKYGVVANQAAIDQEALALGLSFTKGQMDAQTKAAAILSLTTKGTTDAQGDAIRTADSYANQTKGLEAAMMDLKVAVGDSLLPAMSGLVELATKAADRLTVAAGAAGSYEEQVGGIIDSNIETAKSFDDLVREAAKIDEVSMIWGGLGTTITGTGGAFKEGIRDISKELAGSASSFEEFEAVIGTWSTRSRSHFQTFLREQGLTIEEFYEQEQAIYAVNDAVGAHDEVLMNTVANYQNLEQAQMAAAASIREFHQGLAEAAGPNEEFNDKLGQTANLLNEEEAALARSRAELIQLQGEHGNAAGAATGHTQAVQGLISRVRELEGTHTAEIDLRVYGLADLERAQQLIKNASGFNANDQPDPYSTVGNEEIKQQQGDQYDQSSRFADPSYASGTDGWLTVPGPIGSPYPVTLHGGEAFNVVPVGEGTTNNNSNSVSLVQNYYGGDPAMMDRGRDGVKEALDSAGLRGFG